MIDPWGTRDRYNWSDGSVTIVQAYQIDASAPPPQSADTISRVSQELLSGTATDGTNVTVVFVNEGAYEADPVTYRVDPTLDDTNPNNDNSNYATRDHIVSLAPNSTPETVAHEGGHVLVGGARNDYYDPKFDDSGNKIGTEARPGHENTLMGDLGGSTNSQQVDDFLGARADRTFDCELATFSCTRR